MQPAIIRMFAKPSHERDGVVSSPSYLGRALTVTGAIDADGELHIHGNVLGQVCATRLVLGSGGILEGDVVARDVHIGGRLTGRIFALSVTLNASANVTGRIFHNQVNVAKGARMIGRMPWRPPSYFESLKQLPETKQ